MEPAVKPVSLYHLYHPAVGLTEAPRIVARAGRSYGLGQILAIAIVEDSDPAIVADRIEELRGRVEQQMEASGRLAIEAIPVPGDVGRSRRLLPWSRPEQEVAELEARLGRILHVQDPLLSRRECEAAAQRLATENGDDDAPAALACARVAEMLRALEAWRSLVERVQAHRAAYEGRGRAS